MVENPMKPGDLVRSTIFLDLHSAHPKFVENYDPRDVLAGDLGVILEIDEDDPLWSESIFYKQPGLVWVKWCVKGMVGWSDAMRLEVIRACG